MKETTPAAIDAQLIDACKKHLGIRDLVERSNFLFRAGHYELVAEEDSEKLSDAQGIYRFFLIRSLCSWKESSRFGSGGVRK